MQTLILYLKSFGLTPEKIKINDILNDLTGYKEVSKEELNKFAIEFINIYKYYEAKKSEKGIDYPDMLIKFLALKNKVKHKYVLVDELQDINTLEAEIALQSGHNFLSSKLCCEFYSRYIFFICHFMSLHLIQCGSTPEPSGLS